MTKKKKKKSEIEMTENERNDTSKEISTQVRFRPVFVRQYFIVIIMYEAIEGLSK